MNINTNESIHIEMAQWDETWWHRGVAVERRIRDRDKTFSDRRYDRINFQHSLGQTADLTVSPYFFLQSIHCKAINTLWRRVDYFFLSYKSWQCVDSDRDVLGRYIEGTHNAVDAWFILTGPEMSY